MKRTFDYLRRIPFVRDMAILQVGSVLTIVMNFGASILYTRLLGLTQYGIYAIVLSLTATLSIAVNWGQASAMTTFFAEQYGHRDVRGMGRVLSYFLVMTLVMSLLLLIPILFAPWLTNALYGSPAWGNLVRLSFLCILLSAIPSGFYPILQTVREIKLLTFLDQGSTFLQLILVAVFLLTGSGIASIFLGQIIVLILEAPLYLVLYRRLRRRYLLPSVRDIIRPERASFRECFLQGLWIGLDKNVGNLYPNAFFFLLSTVATPAVMGVSRLAFQLSNLPRSVLLAPANQLATTVLPTVSAAGPKTLRMTCVRLLKHALFFHSILTFGAMAAFAIGIPIVYGAEFTRAIPATLWLTLITILSAFNVTNTPLLRLYRRTYVSTIGSVVSVALSCGVLFLLLRINDPLTAFIFTAAAYFIFNQSITAYIYLHLLFRPPTNDVAPLTIIDTEPIDPSPEV